MNIYVVALLFLPFLASAELVQSCHDGDTCRVKGDGRVFKVRLSGIDAPEADQEGGKDARNFLSQLVRGKEVTLKCDGQSYDRRTCAMFLGKVDVQEEMVKAGWAMEMAKFSHGKYKAAQDEAKKKKLGIWGKDFTSPYCFRWASTQKCKSDKTYEP